MRDVKFAACLDSEVAWESDGHGEFTLRATRVLAEGIDTTTNEQFTRRVTEAFGSSARQHPMLDCAPDALTLRLLQPLRDGRQAAAEPIGAIETVPRRAEETTQGAKPNGSSDDALLLQSTLAALQTLVTQLSAR